MKFALIFVTLSTFALTKAFFPGPFRVCEGEVSGFECPVGQDLFPMLVKNVQESGLELIYLDQGI